MEEWLVGLEGRVTKEMNCDLLKAFTYGEVEGALNQMHPLKSSSPNSMSAVFYQHSWATVRNEVCMTVLDFFK